MSTQPTAAEIRTIRTKDGSQLEYEVSGQGPPLLLLHGFMAGRRAFARQQPVLAPHFRLIVPSARGHDGSDAAMPSNYGAGTSDVDDLLTVLAVEGMERVSVIGHSSGGATALVFAVQYPARVDRLVLIEPSVPEIAAAATAPGFRQPIEAAFAEGAAGGPMECLRAVVAILGAEAWRRLDAAAQASRLQALAHLAPLVAPHFQSLLDLPVTAADIIGLRPPTILFYGSASFPFEREIARRIAELCPDLALHMLDGAGHNVHRDASDRFNPLVQQFLEAP